jgi:hypothetical protein
MPPDLSEKFIAADTGKHRGIITNAGLPKIEGTRCPYS